MSGINRELFLYIYGSNYVKFNSMKNLINENALDSINNDIWNGVVISIFNTVWNSVGNTVYYSVRNSAADRLK